MTAMSVPIILDKLDDDTAAFVGADNVTVERQNLFGGTIEVSGRFPVVWLSRDSWVDMGCPTSLMLSLSDVTVSDSPSL